MAESSVQLLLTLLYQAYEQPTWHGPNLRNSLRGLTPAQALWRPAEGRHCIWEHALHCAYWKFMAQSHLEGDLSRGNFPRKPANFPAVPTKPTAGAWKEDLALLHEVHLELRQALCALSPRTWGENRVAGRWPNTLLGPPTTTSITRGKFACCEECKKTLAWRKHECAAE